MKKLTAVSLILFVVGIKAQNQTDTSSIKHYFLNSLSYGVTIGERGINKYDYSSGGLSFNLNGVYYKKSRY